MTQQGTQSVHERCGFDFYDFFMIYMYKVISQSFISFYLKYLDLDILTLQTRGQTLSQLISLLSILNTQGVQVLGATDLELGASGALADLDHLGVLTTGLLEEVTDVGDLLGHVGSYESCRECEMNLSSG